MYIVVAMKTKLVNYIKSFKWKFLIIAVVFCAVAAIVNNIRVDSSKSVEWIGTQPVMQKPAE